jgi:hypothetical protein
MRPRLLLLALLATTMGCRHETDIQPTAQTLADEVVGTYHTNVYLDPSCVALSAGQMPYVAVKAESDSSVTLQLVKRYPIASTQRMTNVVLSRQADVIQLRSAGTSIGTLQTDRVFDNSGMEKQGRLLRVSVSSAGQQSLPFSGFK